jgi:hypothetical protein
MRLTIIADDGHVYVGGVALKVDLTGLDPTIHAVQWYDTYGEVEYKADANGNRKPNLRITDISSHQVFVDRWNAAKTAADAAAKAKSVSSANPINVIAN